MLEDHDVLLTPATASRRRRASAGCRAAARCGRSTRSRGWVPYNGVWNVTGQPAASVPAGFGADGLPRAVQLVGRPNDEATLLSLAAQLEAERPWAQQRPPEFS